MLKKGRGCGASKRKAANESSKGWPSSTSSSKLPLQCSAAALQVQIQCKPFNIVKTKSIASRHLPAQKESDFIPDSVGLAARPALRMRTRQTQRGPSPMTSPREDPERLSIGMCQTLAGTTSKEAFEICDYYFPCPEHFWIKGRGLGGAFR